LSVTTLMRIRPKNCFRLPSGQRSTAQARVYNKNASGCQG
jgi:hypothetical protein